MAIIWGFPISVDGNSVSIPVKGLTEEQIIKLIQQHDAGTA
jgi:hypothetical protein